MRRTLRVARGEQIPINDERETDLHRRAIKNFANFITPLLEGCATIMGFKILLLAGGPIPEFGGEIRTVTYATLTVYCC